MIEFVVETGVEIPGRAGGNLVRYPWEEMAVGDSFFVPFDGPRRGTKAARVANAGNEWAKRNGHPRIKFAGRGVEGGARVWRVA